MANELGEEWNQKKVSQLEDRETIEPDLLEEIAQALKVPVEAIKNFDEEKAIFNISCSFSDHSVNTLYQFNPIEKIVKLYDEKVELLERLLQSEKGKNEMLERLLQDKK